MKKKSPSKLIEIHNRPNYLNELVNNLSKRNYVLYFHNDPLTMTGSKTINQRKFLLKNCFKKLSLIVIGQRKGSWRVCKINLLIVKNF